MEFLTFVLDGKEEGVQVLYNDETIWATQKAMSTLFECSSDYWSSFKKYLQLK